MNRIVGICLRNHEGGENYFNELDNMVKNNIALVTSYVDYIVEKENINSIIASGEIGENLIFYKEVGLINANIVTVNGGLRKGREIANLDSSLITGKQFIFLDDSYYSGKTADKVNEAVEKNGGNVICTYVFYDGSKEKHDNVHSLFRYYDDVELPNHSCENCSRADWTDMYGKLVYICDMSHCIADDEY